MARDQGDRLNDQELFGMIFGLFGALAATSRSAGGALYTLYSHDDQLAQLIRDPALIPDAIEECLRIASNGYFTFARFATRDTAVGGTAIRKGMVVRPSPLAANYDPMCSPILCASTSIASRNGFFRLLSGRTTASATFSAAPPSPSRSAGCWRASPMPGLPIRTSCRSMAGPSANCACKAFP